jgi:CheY-like chemotaxis protein
LTDWQICKSSGNLAQPHSRPTKDLLNSVNEQMNKKMSAEILLVDDNPIQAATRQAILSLPGRIVAVADGAHRALDILQDDKLSSSIRLIITDHCMPGINGPQFVNLLRRRFPTLPVLVLSGLPDVETEYSGLDVIVREKPIPPNHLIALVHSLLDEPMSRTA